MKLINKYWYIILAFTFVAIFFGKLFYPELSIFVTPDFGASDILNFNYPLKEFLSQSLKNNQLPFWSRELATGFPVYAEGQIGTFYIFNLILFKFLPTIWAYNLNFVISYLLAFVFTYLFAQQIKLSKAGSFLAALVFTFSGFISVHLHHFNLVQAACLLPLIFYLVEKNFQKPKIITALLLSIALGQQFFSGDSRIVFITLVGLAVYFLWFLFFQKEKRGSLQKVIILLSFSFILFLGLIAVQFLPSWEYKALTPRGKGSFQNAVSFPYPLIHLKTLIKPYLLGDPRIGTYKALADDWGIFWENTFYVGILPLILMLLSFFRIKKIKIKFFWGLIAFSFLLVLGKYSPLYFIFYFPGFNMFRVPSRYALLIIWSIAILAGFGLEYLLKFIKKKYLKKIVVAFTVLFCFWQLFNFYDNYHPTGRAENWLKIPKSAKFLRTKGQTRILSWLTETNWNKYFLTSGWKEKEVYNFLRNSLKPNLNLLYKINSLRTNDPLQTKRMLLFNYLNLNSKLDLGKKEVFMTDNLLKILSTSSVSHIISPYKIKNDNLRLVKEIKPVNSAVLSIDKPEKVSSFKIYENKMVLGRVRLYGFDDIKIVKTALVLDKLFFSRDFVKNNYLLLEKQPLCKGGKINTFPGEAEIMSDKQSRIEIETKSSDCSILLLADSFVPGWKAYIDGKETEILAANINQKAIVLPKGKHQVLFEYEPAGFKKGLIITTATVFLAILLALGAFAGIAFCRILPFGGH